MATRTKIKQIRGEIILGTKTEIDDKHLEGGWTAKGFVERLAAKCIRLAVEMRARQYPTQAFIKRGRSDRLERYTIQPSSRALAIAA